jgi:hypothetical protein
MPPDLRPSDLLSPERGVGGELLAYDLRALVADLPDLDVDLGGLMTRLRRDVARVVPSTVGLTVAVWSDISLPIRFTLVDEPFRPAAVRATLRLPMDRLSARNADGTITYYAAQPDAFADLAVDLAHALDLPPGLAVLDEPPHRAVMHSGVTGMVASSVVNRAMGILIAKGVAPADARTAFRGDRGLSAVRLADAVELVATSSTRWPHDL